MFKALSVVLEGLDIFDVFDMENQLLDCFVNENFILQIVCMHYIASYCWCVC